MAQIHVTTLSSFWSCPQKWKEDRWEILLEKTHHGDIANIAATSHAKTIEDFRSYMEPIIAFYSRYLVWWIKMKQTLKEITEKIRHKMNAYRKKHDIIVQEAKMFLPYGEWKKTWIVWTPDIYIINKNEDGTIKEIIVEDFKCWDPTRYDEDSRWKNLQTVIYPLFLWARYKEREGKPITFTYNIFSKKNASETNYSIERNMKECWDLYRVVVEEFMEADITQEYEARKNKFCVFCPIWKTGNCRLYGGFSDIT